MCGEIVIAFLYVVFWTVAALLVMKVAGILKDWRRTARICSVAVLGVFLFVGAAGATFGQPTSGKMCEWSSVAVKGSLKVVFAILKGL